MSMEISQSHSLLERSLERNGPICVIRTNSFLLLKQGYYLRTYTNISKILPMPEPDSLPPHPAEAETITVMKLRRATSALRSQYEKIEMMIQCSLIPSSYNPIWITSLFHSSLLRDLISTFKFRFVASSPVNPRSSELKLCNSEEQGIRKVKKVIMRSNCLGQTGKNSTS